MPDGAAARSSVVVAALVVAAAGAVADEPQVVIADRAPADVGPVHVRDGVAVFRGWSHDAGEEPWVTDGTPEGTRLLADLVPGSADSRCSPLGFLGARLLVAADDGTDDGALWSVALDGTSAEVIHDRRAYSVAVMGERAVFGGLDGLHVTDGTAAGTRRLDGVPAPSFYGVYTVGARAVYFADDGVVDPSGGQDLWSTDGTEDGTLKLGNFGTLTYGLGRSVALADDALWFTAPMGIWSTDGTPDGTSYRAFLVAFDFYHPTGPQPDLHAAGPHVAWTFRESRTARFTGTFPFSLPTYPARYGDYSLGGRLLASSDGRLFLAAMHGRTRRTTRLDLWVREFDGEPRIVRLPSRLTTPLEMHAVGDTGRAVWTTERRGRAGRQVWITDGTRGGTRRLAVLERRNAPGLPSPGPRVVGVLGTRVLCLAPRMQGIDDGCALVAIDAGASDR